MKNKHFSIPSLVAATITCLAALHAASLLAKESPASSTQAGGDAASAADDKAASLLIRKENEHPLTPILRWAHYQRPKIAALKDYTARLTKRENIDGVLKEAQVMEIKVRHQPFSVYVKTRFPHRLNGQEAIFVQGENDGKIVGHGAGTQRAVGTQRVDPHGFLAMRDNKYPITDMGFLNLIDKLLEVGQKDVQFGECEVRYVENVKVGERACLMLVITHPTPRKTFIFHIARVFIDTETKLPIRYESHGWPATEDGKPPLIEEYTYEDVRRDVGLTDLDFDYRNPAYGYTISDHHVP